MSTLDARPPERSQSHLSTAFPESAIDSDSTLSTLPPPCQLYFNQPKQVMHRISAPVSSESPELLHSLGNSKADQTEDMLSIASQRKTDHARVQMIPPTGSECVTVHQVNEEFPTADRALILRIPTSNDSQELHNVSISTNAPASTSSSTIITAPHNQPHQHSRPPGHAP
ncbi:hypothetical protein BJV74DRAFT_890290 [Russula compacta]|nr:hypothetical protein BJV74DRAFT_890290 [Russula compacta]